MTRKNAKSRRLVELYPDLNIRMLYRRDCARLELKALLAASRAPGTPATHPSTMAG